MPLLDLDDLPGVRGLKALRVDINLEAEELIPVGRIATGPA